jgi:phosphotriesterase-related protein
MGDTKIKAGQIKCAVSARFIHPNEEKLLRAAARAQRVTHAPIWIHHGGMEGMRILDILEEEGVDLDRVVLGHMDRNPDPYEYKRIARRGCFMSIDNIARLYRYPVETNVDMLKDLIELGYLGKVLISADFGRTTYLEAYGGGPGFSYLLNRFVPRIREECHLTSKDIDTLFSENPAKAYACF